MEASQTVDWQIAFSDRAGPDGGRGLPHGRGCREGWNTPLKPGLGLSFEGARTSASYYFYWSSQGMGRASHAFAPELEPVGLIKAKELPGGDSRGLNLRRPLGPPSAPLILGL